MQGGLALMITLRWSNGVLECWSVGVLECWSIGVVACWSAGVLEQWSFGLLGFWVFFRPRYTCYNEYSGLSICS